MLMSMIYLSAAALSFLLIGIFASVSLVGLGQILLVIPLFKSIQENIRAKTLALPKSAYWLLGFILIAVISLVVNAEDIPRVSRNFTKLKYPLFGVVGIYFFRYWLKDSSDGVKKWVLNLFFISVIGVAIAGMVSFFMLDVSRIKGLTQTMRYGYGSAMFLSALLATLLYPARYPWFNRHLATTAFILGFIGMTLTFTRGAMLGFLCSLPFIFYFYNKKIGLLVGSLSLVAALTWGGFYFFGKTNVEGSRFLISKDNRSDATRKSIFDSAVIAIKERPVLGWGYSNFHSQMLRIKTQYDLPHKEFYDSHAHNVFLEITAGTGVIGLFFFLGWLITWALESFKSPWGRAIIVPFGVVFVISGQFEVTFDANTSTLIFLCYSLSSSLFMAQKS